MSLLLELPDNQEAALQNRARALGLSAEQYAVQVLNRDLEGTASFPAGTSRRHISERIREIMSDVPREVFETFPQDGASEHDHYLYGTSRRNQGRPFLPIHSTGSL